MAVKKINKQDFLDWLDSKPDFDTVGYAVKADSCPIAQFYREMGATFSSVGPGRVNFADEKGYDRKHNLPEWAKRFIRYVDDMHNARQRVSAERAKYVFERVT